mgnify:CR=1 FL=1
MPVELEPIEEAPAEPVKRKRGRPPGSKNKVKKPPVQLEEVPQQQPQEEEAPPSPRTQKRMYLQQTAQAQAKLHERKMQYFANMLSKTLPH